VASASPSAPRGFGPLHNRLCACVYDEASDCDCGLDSMRRDLASFASALVRCEEVAGFIEADRRETDKVLCHVQSLRGVVGRALPDPAGTEGEGLSRVSPPTTPEGEGGQA
jgi:hypothetical protein